MSTTLSDRLTRGTYLFDNGPDQPGVICLSYSWMSDAMKVLPLSADQRVNLMLGALEKIYPDLDLKQHIVGDPVTVSWENDPGFLGAFKGALPGHYRYNRRMFCQFMQESLAPAERGIFLAGDDISWTPGWVEGAVQTALNAVWGIMHHFGGATAPENPGPGDCLTASPPRAAGLEGRKEVPLFEKSGAKTSICGRGGDNALAQQKSFFASLFTKEAFLLQLSAADRMLAHDPLYSLRHLRRLCRG